MPHNSAHPRYITTIPGGLLVAIPVAGKRAVTKTLRALPSVSDADQIAEAIRWRDRAWRRLFGGEVPVRSFHTHARAGSATGVPGVRHVCKIVRKGERSYVIPCVIAEVHTIPGRDYERARGSRSRVYSLHKYDYDEAVALGAAWRAEMVAELSGARISVVR